MNVADTQTLSYPDADPSLGEALQADEVQSARELADTIAGGIQASYAAGGARRDVHTKATGCVRAEFRVSDTIPGSLAKGVFIPGKTYQAWIRFSNGSAEPGRSDDNEDGRGMAIKLLDVPGEKLLDNQREATTQDFILINHPVFFINNIRGYIALVEKAGGGIVQKLSIPFAVGLKTLQRFQHGNSGKISNPLQIRYYSAVAYKLGSGPESLAVKYGVIPVSDKVDPIPRNPGPDYLSETMQASLSSEGVDMKFLIQPRTSEKHNVEDTMTEWPEGEAPFHEVATIHIPAQVFRTPVREELAENLSFNPWHALPEHRPLGAVNRVRKIIYERISRVRRQMNFVNLEEP